MMNENGIVDDDDMFEKITVDVVHVHHETGESHEDLEEDEIKILPDDDEENTLCQSCAVAENEDTLSHSFSTSSLEEKISTTDENDEGESCSDSSEEAIVDKKLDEPLILELPKTVQEMKEMIKLRKRSDPRTERQLDLWQKHSIIQAL